LQIEPKKLSAWFNLRLKAFNLHGEDFVTYLDSGIKSNASKGCMRRLGKEAAKMSMEEQFEEFKVTGLRDFQGDFPVARLNYFDIQQLAVETILELGKKRLSDPRLHELRLRCFGQPGSQCAAVCWSGRSSGACSEPRGQIKSEQSRAGIQVSADPLVAQAGAGDDCWCLGREDRPKTVEDLCWKYL